MKKVLLFLLPMGLWAQTSLYVHPDFSEIAAEHQKIAIVPFKTQVKLRPRQMKEMTPEQIYTLERSEGESMQTAMYSWFLRRKKRGKMTQIEVQDPQVTTALLKRNEIDYENLRAYTPQELAKILAVDAVISGDYETDKPMSDGASIALGLLVGFWGTTNTALVNMSVHNSSDGVLLWNYNKKIHGSLGSSPEDLINIIMRKASRRMAYVKELENE